LGKDMYCRKCGTQAQEEAIFCHVCGNLLKDVGQVNVAEEQAYENVEKRKREKNNLDTINFIIAIISVSLMVVAFIPYVPIIALVLGGVALVVAIILEIKKKYKFSLLSLYLAAGGILANILLLIYFSSI